MYKTCQFLGQKSIQFTGNVRSQTEAPYPCELASEQYFESRGRWNGRPSPPSTSPARLSDNNRLPSADVEVELELATGMGDHDSVGAKSKWMYKRPSTIEGNQ